MTKKKWERSPGRVKYAGALQRLCRDYKAVGRETREHPGSRPTGVGHGVVRGSLSLG